MFIINTFSSLKHYYGNIESFKEFPEDNLKQCKITIYNYNNKSDYVILNKIKGSIQDIYVTMTKGCTLNLAGMSKLSVIHFVQQNPFDKNFNVVNQVLGQLPKSEVQRIYVTCYSDSLEMLYRIFHLVTQVKLYFIVKNAKKEDFEFLKNETKIYEKICIVDNYFDELPGDYLLMYEHNRYLHVPVNSFNDSYEIEEHKKNR